MIEDVVAVSPVHFFSLAFSCPYFGGKKGEPLSKNYLLADLATLFYDETPFATLHLGWSEKGLFSTIHLKVPFQNALYPRYREGDSVEFFIDTRDQKSPTLTPFCHHFCFLPVGLEIQGEALQGIEVTKWRQEASRPLALPSLLFVRTEEKQKATLLHIFIPKEALHGYDPSEFKRLGFTYRVNRTGSTPQFFSAPGSEIALESHPAHWASVELVDGKR